ncbi:MAG: chromosomal replication initiator protein DnaA [Candidatus Tyloplasma litorale]|nr:MAG: chromosomal replication initiator protein DnaA [Mycoplasmatales bacterium]
MSNSIKRKDLNQMLHSIKNSLFINEPDKRNNILNLLEGSRFEEINEFYSKIIISVNSEFVKEVLESNEFKSEFRKSSNKTLNSNYEVGFVLREDWEKRNQKTNNNNIFDELEIKQKHRNNDAELNNDLTLSNFIAVGTNTDNKMVKQAALSVSLKPGDWNPFFIYGGSGLGKTHLLHGIGNKLKENFPNHYIKYLESKDFKDLVYDSEAINTKKVNNITKDILSYDILLVDDIQMLQTLTKAKEIFFNILSNFINEKKQIVITSDQYPEEMKDFEERFITRFKGGVLLSVTPPDIETAKMILAQKLKKKDSSGGIVLADDALDFIASNFGSNVRELEGSLGKIIFWSIVNDRNSNEPYTAEDMANIFEGMTTNKGLTMQRIVSVIAKNYQVKVSDILGKSRKAEIALPRHLSIYFSRKILNVSLMDIGRYFSRNHSTIMSSVKKIEKESLRNESLSKVIYDIRKKLISKK